MWTRLLVFGRLVAAVAIALFAVAVLLGRSGSNGSMRRSPASYSYQPTASTVALEVDCGLRVLDVETGELKRIRLPASDQVPSAACSPWRDSRGRTHLVGQCRVLETDGLVTRRCLARYALPGAEVLDLVDLEFPPIGTPCWFPGPSPRIVYGAGDWQLYRVDFQEHSAEGDDSSKRRIQPEPLAWHCELPGEGEVSVENPTWPTAPAMGGRLLVSLSYLERLGRGASFLPWQIWWLRLSDDGRTIEGAGRLIAPAPGEDYEPKARERFASISATPRGGLALAYVALRADGTGHQLRVGPVAIDAATGTPRVEESDTVAVADDRAPHPPVFSPDGCWIYSLPRAGGTPDRAERHSVADALARSPARSARSRRVPNPAG